MNRRLIIDEIRCKGFAIVPDIVSSDEAAALRSRVLALQAEDGERYGAAYLYRIGQEGFVVNLGNRGPEFERLLNRRPLAPVVDALLGEDAILYLFQGVIVPPGGGAGAYPWKWHCDLMHVLRSVPDPDFIPGLNMLLFVEDVGPDNGATWLIPGSNGMDDDGVPFRSATFRGLAEFQITARAGSALLLNPLLWHCAGTNATMAPRCAVKMLAVHSWMVPQMDYARALDAPVVERLNEGARRLLGHESMIARSFTEAAVSPFAA